MSGTLEEDLERAKALKADAATDLKQQAGRCQDGLCDATNYLPLRQAEEAYDAANEEVKRLQAAFSA